MGLNCTDFEVQSQNFLSALTKTETLLLFITGGLFVIDTIICIDSVLFLWRKYRLNQLKKAAGTATWLVAICPALAFICWVSMLIPKAFLLREVLVVGCISVGMQKFVQLLSLFVNHYTWVRTEISNTQRMHFDLPPFACCCKCLPTAQVTRPRVRIVRGLVLQFPLVCFPISLLSMYLWLDGKFEPGLFHASNPWTYLMILRVFSSLVASYSLGILFELIKEPLSMTYISQKYLSLKICIAVFYVQNLVFKSVSSAFPSRGCFSSQMMANFYENVAFSFELFVISLVNLWAYRRPVATPDLLGLAKADENKLYDNGGEQAIDSEAAHNASYTHDIAICEGVTNNINDVENGGEPPLSVVADGHVFGVSSGSYDITGPGVDADHYENPSTVISKEIPVEYCTTVFLSDKQEVPGENKTDHISAPIADQSPVDSICSDRETERTQTNDITERAQAKGDNSPVTTNGILHGSVHEADTRL